jgi:hypothetical protein
MSALLKRVARSASESAGWAQTEASCSAVRLVPVISAASEKRCSNLLMLHFNTRLGDGAVVRKSWYL